MELVEGKERYDGASDRQRRGAAMTDYCEKLYPLCQALGQTALEMAGQCELTVTEHGTTDPKFLALTLLCRTISNFRGVVLLIQENLVVEARVLTRCCYEN